MPTKWFGVTEETPRDHHGNVVTGLHLLLIPDGKSPEQVRAEAAAWNGPSVLCPEGYLYVCTHCGSRRLDNRGLSSYDDNEGNPYVWEPICIQNAVLVSEEEYRRGREIYDANHHHGHR